jgi:hypothetical protein
MPKKFSLAQLLHQINKLYLFIFPCQGNAPQKSVTPDSGVFDSLLLPFLFRIIVFRETELGELLQEPQG